MEEYRAALAEIAQDLFNVDIEPELTRPDEQFGDYATNVALQLAGKLDNSPAGGPREIAESLSAALKERLGDKIGEVAVAGPGFINLTLTDNALVELQRRQPAEVLAGQKVVAEYSDPNPFKVLHAGHLYTSIEGDALANLFETAGADVHRVNFGGDVGLHVGKTMWAMLRKLGGEQPDKLAEINPEERAEWMAAAYVEGSNAYEDDEEAKQAITALNKRVYQLHAENDHDSPFAQIYWTAREWSYEYFNQFYARIGVHFERYYPESETAELGLATVRQHIGDVFEESEGAVVFRGEEHGLHTRVFINREGLPTYEAKDVGLIMKKFEDYGFDMSVIITGNEQEQYMKVVLKAIEQFAPELARATRHLTHGMVKLKGADNKGEKMSSRKGNILRAVDILNAAAAANKEASGNEDERVVLAAVKYFFLKQRIGGDFVYDPEESVSLKGNSGPYLQYAHARARSILGKAGATTANLGGPFEAGERSLLRKLGEYPEVVEQAVQDLAPSHICTYLYELSQAFNRFYEGNRVIGNPREQVRLRLVEAYADTLKKGLSLLGIEAPDKM